jgi:hypothetical protein
MGLPFFLSRESKESKDEIEPIMIREHFAHTLVGENNGLEGSSYIPDMQP